MTRINQSLPRQARTVLGLSLSLALMLTACSGERDTAARHTDALQATDATVTSVEQDPGREPAGSDVAGDATSSSDTTPGAVTLPDACALVPSSDLQALFPGRPIAETDRNLSLLSQGPQFVQSCTHTIRLPNPRSSGDTATYASVVVLQYNAKPKDFAYILEQQSLVTGIRESKLEPLDGIGDEAYQEVSAREVGVGIRKGSLLYTIKLDNYSAQSLPNLLALARQSAARWQDGVGMVAAGGTAATNADVEVPEDTRKSAQAPPEEWPDACAMIAREDVAATFGGAKLKGPDATHGKLTRIARETTSAALPHPISCGYDAVETATVDGKRDLDVTTIRLRIADMAATPALGERMFKVIGSKTELPGLADQATIDIDARSIAMRKGRLNVILLVASAKGGRDQAARDRDIERLKALAPRVAARMP